MAKRVLSLDEFSALVQKGEDNPNLIDRVECKNGGRKFVVYVRQGANQVVCDIDPGKIMANSEENYKDF